MGRKVVVVDDVTGEELGDDAETVTLVYQGTEYALDLGEKSKDKLDKALAPFLENATKLGGARRTRSSGGSAPARTDREQLQAMREWLRAQGEEVSSRGRIPQRLQEMYHSAH